MSRPLVIILAGPNGAGKSTAAFHLLPDAMTFLNADEIAKTLPGYPSPAADFASARILIEQMGHLQNLRADFAVETTLASRTLAPRIAQLRESGYLFRLIFLYLPSPELSIPRVAGRVLLGGHHIPEATIRRRYVAGLKNFFELFQPLADLWGVYNACRPEAPELIAGGGSNQVTRIEIPAIWRIIQNEGHHES